MAKLNSDWLLRAEPMKTWLPAKSHLPLIGPYLYDEWVAYLFSWFGAGYDLFIVFFLMNCKTRPIAYLLVLRHARPKKLIAVGKRLEARCFAPL
mgnify:CR=1 FL=1